ncbi:MAG: ferritin family protein [Actinobacteria bacterium]|nr:ferritin family protein [Actinomycetota bacterium]
MDNYQKFIKFASDFEEKGNKFYLESIDRVKNIFSKRILEFLATEELRHLAKIKLFSQSLMEKDEFDVDKETESDLLERVKRFIQDFMQDKVKQITDILSDIEIYDFALGVEKNGYNVYKEFFEKSEDKKLKRFAEFLMNEEKIHYDLLADSKKYLEDPSYYFEEAGGWIFG